MQEESARNPRLRACEIVRMERSTHILPRFIRHRDAPAYLGMNRNKFNAEVRPYLTEIPLGKQSIAYDRLELDAWAPDMLDELEAAIVPGSGRILLPGDL